MCRFFTKEKQEAHGGPEFTHQIKLAQMLSSFIPTSFSEVKVNVIWQSVMKITTFKLVRPIFKAIILTKFHEDFAKMSHLVLTSLSNNLTVWPDFWSDMTKSKICMIYYQGNNSDTISWHKMLPLECLQAFPIIWPSDLVFDKTWSSFKLVWAIIKAIILTKFHED